jgi:hypothetical protein
MQMAGRKEEHKDGRTDGPAEERKDYEEEL